MAILFAKAGSRVSMPSIWLYRKIIFFSSLCVLQAAKKESRIIKKVIFFLKNMQPQYKPKRKEMPLMQDISFKINSILLLFNKLRRSHSFICVHFKEVHASWQ